MFRSSCLGDLELLVVEDSLHTSFLLNCRCERADMPPYNIWGGFQPPPGSSTSNGNGRMGPRRPRFPPRKQKSPQEKVDDFWKMFTSENPGKGKFVAPRRIVSFLVALHSTRVTNSPI